MESASGRRQLGTISSRKHKFAVMLGLSALKRPRSLVIFYLIHVWTGMAIVAHDVIPYSTENQVSNSDIDAFRVHEAIATVKEVVRNISNILDEVETGKANCVTVQCRVICSSGRQERIAHDISLALEKRHVRCTVIEELYLYNYKYPNGVVPVGFLSTYTNMTKLIYLGISEVTAIESGAFGGGIFNHIVLEDLQLNHLDKGFFTNISSDFKRLSIIQHNVPLEDVNTNFLDNVVYQIEYLRLEGGIQCLRNITATDASLGALVHADFSNNNIGSALLEDSFSKLTMVEILVLSYSNIEYLPNYIFQGMKYLEYLDISHNKLKTLAKNIFGIHEMSSTLKIEAGYNEWHCNCQLQKEMNAIFVYHNTKLSMYCSTPEKHKNKMVFDERLCNDDYDYEVVPPEAPKTTTKKWYTSTTRSTTEATSLKTTTPGGIFIPTISTAFTVDPNEIVALDCRSSNVTVNARSQSIRWPQVNFVPSYCGALSVKISVEDTDTKSSHGVFWFSKTTKEYYMMEMLPDHFGLGCYFTIPLLTLVTELVPNVAYTFCLVDDGHNSVSPFSCKSVQVGGNLDANYNSWPSDGLLAKGISLMVLGVVMSMLIGILFMYLVLKKKPSWIKGSKRIIKPKYSSGEIVVLPRNNTANKFKKKEKMIAQGCDHRCVSFCPRRSSIDSLASSDSYIYTNLYEVIPAYISFDKIPQSVAPEPEMFCKSQLRSSMASRDSVRYAQIKPRTKRVSSDPLPALPAEAEQN